MMPVDLPLRDIHLPEAIGGWPPAFGWWLLAMLLPLLLAGLWWLYKRLTRKTALKTACKLLRALQNDSTLSDLEKVAAVSALLRRVAISIDTRNEVAGLTGKNWLAYLDASVKGAPFSDGPGSVLLDAHYRQSLQSGWAARAFFAVCEDWLKAQRKRKT